MEWVAGVEDSLLCDPGCVICVHDDFAGHPSWFFVTYLIIVFFSTFIQILTASVFVLQVLLRYVFAVFVHAWQNMQSADPQVLENPIDWPDAGASASRPSIAMQPATIAASGTPALASAHSAGKRRHDRYAYVEIERKGDPGREHGPGESASLGQSAVQGAHMPMAATQGLAVGTDAGWSAAAAGVVLGAADDQADSEAADTGTPLLRGSEAQRSGRPEPVTATIGTVRHGHGSMMRGPLAAPESLAAPLVNGNRKSRQFSPATSPTGAGPGFANPTVKLNSPLSPTCLVEQMAHSHGNRRLTVRKSERRDENKT